MAFLIGFTNTAFGLPAKIQPAVQKVAVDPITAILRSKTLTKDQILYVLKRVGFKGTSLRVAYGVVMKESQGHPGSHDLNPRTGDDSYGLFQINLYGSLKNRIAYYRLDSREDLKNPVINAAVAYVMSSNGKNFSPWHVSYFNKYRTSNSAVNAYLGKV